MKQDGVNRWGLVLLGAVLCAGCQPKPAGVSVQADEARTREVLEHHWKTFKDNDLEGTMSDYSEESVLITPNRTYKGLQEIRDNFVAAFAAYPKDATAMQLDKSVVQRDIGYILWEATAPKVRLSFGTDTFVIRDGKILSQTYGGVATPQ
jgi:hypothetical protein